MSFARVVSGNFKENRQVKRKKVPFSQGVYGKSAVSPLTTPQKPDKIWVTYLTCVEKDKYPPPRRKESRRLVRGGREGAAKITFELRAEMTSKLLRTPPLPGSF